MLLYAATSVVVEGPAVGVGTLIVPRFAVEDSREMVSSGFEKLGLHFAKFCLSWRRSCYCC